MIAFYIIGGIVLLLLLLVITTPTDFKIESEIVISKPKSEVFEYLKSLRNQDNWSIWNMKDPNMKKEYRGIDGTVGFVVAWDSVNKNAGKGEQEIINIAEGERVDCELRFEKPMKSTNYASLKTQTNVKNETIVTWSFNGKVPRPMNLMTLVMKGMLLKEMNNGLANLKNILEK